MKRYDYLIVGAGLYGSMMAYKLTMQGRQCLVIDKRGRILAEIFTARIFTVLTFINMARISSILQTKRYGILSILVYRSTDTPIRRWQDIRTSFIIFLSI